MIRRAFRVNPRTSIVCLCLSTGKTSIVRTWCGQSKVKSGLSDTRYGKYIRMTVQATLGFSKIRNSILPGIWWLLAKQQVRQHGNTKNMNNKTLHVWNAFRPKSSKSLTYRIPKLFMVPRTINWMRNAAAQTTQPHPPSGGRTGSNSFLFSSRLLIYCLIAIMLFHSDRMALAFYPLKRGDDLHWMPLLAVKYVQAGFPCYPIKLPNSIGDIINHFTRTVHAWRGYLLAWEHGLDHELKAWLKSEKINTTFSNSLQLYCFGDPRNGNWAYNLEMFFPTLMLTFRRTAIIARLHSHESWGDVDSNIILPLCCLMSSSWKIFQTLRQL